MVGRKVSSDVRDAEVVYASSGQIEHSDDRGDGSQMNTSGPVGKLSVVGAQKTIEEILID